MPSYFEPWSNLHKWQYGCRPQVKKRRCRGWGRRRPSTWEGEGQSAQAPGKISCRAYPQLHPQEVECEAPCPGPGLEAHTLLCVCSQVSTEAPCVHRALPLLAGLPFIFHSPALLVFGPMWPIQVNAMRAKPRVLLWGLGPSSAFSVSGPAKADQSCGPDAITASFHSAQGPRQFLCVSMVRRTFFFF